MKPIPILMPTAPWYAALARWTCGQIQHFWPNHPEIFVCGLSELELMGDVQVLPLQEDPRHWMRIVRGACADLLARGIEQVYLILDDHPPIAPCHAWHLSHTLPDLAREMQATCVMTFGYGPLLARKGKCVAWRQWWPECLPLAEPWKLPLHPALWDLQRLFDILHHLIQKLPSEQQTPWAFERIGSDLKRSGLPKEWLSACWRVGGWEMSLPATQQLHNLQDWGMRLGLKGLQMGWRLLPATWRNCVEMDLACESFAHPRIGPYPVFWSGVMKKGQLNAHYLLYSKWKRRSELIAGLERHLGAI